jgi:hypothetical protein
MQNISFEEDSSNLGLKCILAFMYSAHYFCSIVKKLVFSHKDKYSNINVTKIHPVGAEMFHVERQMDMMKLTVASCKMNAPKNSDRIQPTMCHIPKCEISKVCSTECTCTLPEESVVQEETTSTWFETKFQAALLVNRCTCSLCDFQVK